MVSQATIVEPPEISTNDLLTVHTQRYINSLHVSAIVTNLDHLADI